MYYEDKSNTQAGVNFLHGTRLFRTRLMWEAVKDWDNKRRKPAGFHQRTQGLLNFEEDPLVSLIGLRLRQVGDSTIWLDCKNRTKDFVYTFCTWWALPLSRPDEQTTAERAWSHVGKTKESKTFQRQSLMQMK